MSLGQTDSGMSLARPNMAGPGQDPDMLGVSLGGLVLAAMSPGGEQRQWRILEMFHGVCAKSI